MNRFGKVAVMFGGTSAERAVSLNSGAAVLAALQSRGVDAHAFDPAERPLADLQTEGFNRVFIALHGRGGEDGTLQGALTLMNLPFTGSGVLASALAMDKWRSKLVWQALGLPIPDYAVLTADSDFTRWSRNLACRCSSNRRAKVPASASSRSKPPPNCRRRIRSSPARQPGSGGTGDDRRRIHRHHPGQRGNAKTGLGTAVDPHRAGHRVLRLRGQIFRDDTRYLCPSGLSEAAEAQMRATRGAGYQALGCRGWARIDFLLDAAGAPYLLEANTAPGMTSHSLAPMAARVDGLEFADLCVRILEMCC
jgi:D-alanine-D-alanine ligase